MEKKDLLGNYTLDTSHSSVGFWARHAMVTKIKGSFTEFEGKGTISESGGEVNLTIKASSITTGNADRDNHLKSEDFFNTDKFPEITFKSKSLAYKDGAVNLVGELTMVGVSKELQLELEVTGTSKDPYGNTRVGFEGNSTLKRSDFGLNWNAALELGGVLVSDEIHLNFELSTIKN